MAPTEKHGSGNNPGVVVDKNGQPLCWMPMDEILGQKLYHCSIAILAMDRKGQLLLRIQPGDICDFPYFEILPAGYGLYERARSLAMREWQTENVTTVRRLKPCLENRLSFTTIFRASISNSMAAMHGLDRRHSLLADYMELAALLKHGCGFSPLLELFLRQELEPDHS